MTTLPSAPSPASTTTGPSQRMYWLHALSPVHVGVGRGVGYIDLPLMRERATGWPIIPGSAVKGVQRDSWTDAKASISLNGRPGEEAIKVAFGQADGSDINADASAGSLVYTDARIVCLPVRSYYGTFAWVTCPGVLRRLRRDLQLISTVDRPEIPTCSDEQLRAAHKTVVKNNNGIAYLEDMDFTGVVPDSADGNVTKWAQLIAKAAFPKDDQADFQSRVAVLSDDVFTYFCETATEVTARVCIDDDMKTVKRGQLWYEESLPTESILAGLVWCDRVFANMGSTPIEPKQILECFAPVSPGATSSAGRPLQIGGKASVGRGRMRCRFGMGT